MSDRPRRPADLLGAATTRVRAAWSSLRRGAAEIGAATGPSPRPPATGDRGRILPDDPGPIPLGGIDHLEWYVGNAGHTAAWLERLGFRVVAQQGPETGVQDIVSLLVAAGGARVLLTSGLTPAHDATRSVAARGDAVLDVALVVPDVERAYGRIIHSGMEPDHLPVDMRAEGSTLTLVPVTTADDVLHTLVARQGDGGGPDFAPGFVAAGAPGDPERPSNGITGVVAVTTVVAAGRLQDVLAQYRQLFDLAEVGRGRGDDVEVAVLARPDDIVAGEPARLAVGAMRLVFASPTRRTERNHLDDFLARHGGSGVRALTLATTTFDGDLASWRAGSVALLGSDADPVATTVAGDMTTRRAVTEPLQPRTPLLIALEDAPDGVVDPVALAVAEEAALAAHRRAHPDAPPLGTWTGGR